MIGRVDLVREGLARILAENSFSVIASTSNIDELDLQVDTDPFIIVIDGTPEELCADKLRRAHDRFPQARVIAMTDIFDMECLRQVFAASGHGYIVRQCSCEALIASLKLAHAGVKIIPPEVADSIGSGGLDLPTIASSAAETQAALSERETEILRCLLEGHPNKIISRKLEISEATVKVHVKAVFRKLKVTNRTQAAMWAATNRVAGMRPSAANANGHDPSAFSFGREFDLVDMCLTHESVSSGFAGARAAPAAAWKNGSSS